MSLAFADLTVALQVFNELISGDVVVLASYQPAPAWDHSLTVAMNIIGNDEVAATQ